MSKDRLSQDDNRPFAERLLAYGCMEVTRLDHGLSDPAQLEYLDILHRRAGTLTAVTEHQGTALLYIVDGSHEARRGNLAFSTLEPELANRSHPAWLEVVRPGSLEIFPRTWLNDCDSHCL